jgi:hypothetical protein
MSCAGSVRRAQAQAQAHAREKRTESGDDDGNEVFAEVSRLRLFVTRRSSLVRQQLLVVPPCYLLCRGVKARTQSYRCTTAGKHNTGTWHMYATASHQPHTPEIFLPIRELGPDVVSSNLCLQGMITTGMYLDWCMWLCDNCSHSRLLFFFLRGGVLHVPEGSARYPARPSCLLCRRRA